MKGYSPKEFADLLGDYGWQCSRRTRMHHTYVKDNCRDIITIPFHQKEICRPMAKRLLKMAGIR